MKLLALATFVVVCGAAKLDRSYLPPANAKTSGGSDGSLQTPYSANSLEGAGGLPKGSYTNEHQGVVVDAALAGTRMTGQSGLGAPRIQYGSTDSKVGSAAFRDRPSGGQGQAQVQQPRPWNNGLGGIPYGGSQTSFNQQQENQRPQGINQGFQGINKQQSQGQSAYQSQESQSQQPERPRASLDRNANTVKLTSEVGPEDFKYAFETDNGITAEEKGVEANGVQAEGAFSYTGDDGQKYTVTYTADENGYQPEGDHLPTPPPVPEEILKSLEQNARDEAAGINDDGSYDEKKYNAGSEYSNTDDGKYTHQSDGDIIGNNNRQTGPFGKPNYAGQNTQQFGKLNQAGSEHSSHQNRPTLGLNAKPGKFDHEGPSFSFGENVQNFGKPNQSGFSNQNRPSSGQNAKPGKFDYEGSFNFGQSGQSFGTSYQIKPTLGHNAEPGKFDQEGSTFNFDQSIQNFGKPDQSVLNNQNRPTLGHNAKPGKFDQEVSTFNFDQSLQNFGKPDQSGFNNQNRPILGHNAKPGKFDHEIPSLNFGSTYQQSSSSGYFEQTGTSEVNQGNNNEYDQSSGSFGPSISSGSKPSNSFGFSSNSAVPQSSQGFGNVNQYGPPGNKFNSRPQSSQGVPETKPQDSGSSESSESSSSEEDSSEENTSPNTPQQNSLGQSFPSKVSGSSNSNKLSQNGFGSRPTQNSFGQKLTGKNFVQRQPNQPNIGFGNQNFPPFSQSSVQGQGLNDVSPQNNDNYKVSGFQSSFSIPSGSQSPFAQNPTQNQDQEFNVANQQNSGNYQAPGFQSHFPKPGQNQAQLQSSFPRPIPSRVPSVQTSYESQQFNAVSQQSNLDNENDRFPQASGQYGPDKSQHGQSAVPSTEFTARPGTGLTTPSYSTPKPEQLNNQYSSSTPSSYLAPTISTQSDFAIGPISVTPIDQYKGPLLPGSQSQTSGNQLSPSTQKPGFSQQTNAFSQTSDSQFAASTQRPSFSQESNFESSYYYTQPSQSLPNQASIPSNHVSSFSSQGSISQNQESTFPNQGGFSPQRTGFPDQSSSFPTQESFSSSQGSGFPTQQPFSSSQGSGFPTKQSFSSSQVSSFPAQESFSSSQVSSLPTQESFPLSQVSSFPTQGSSFPEQVSTISSQSSGFQGSSGSYANSQSTPSVQYSPQGPINYPNPPTIPSPAPTSSANYQGQTVSGITQASASSFPSVSTISSLNAQSLPSFQQSTQYNQGSTNSLSFDQSTIAPQIPQSFKEQSQQSLVNQYQGSQYPGSYSQTVGKQFSLGTQQPSIDQSQSTEDSKRVLTQQYEGELYEYNKPAQLPPAPENEGQPGAGQFGNSQETTQQENDVSNTETPEFGSQTSSQQFDARPQSTLSFEGTNYPELEPTIDSNQFDQYNQNSESLSTPQSAVNVNLPQGSLTTQSPDQYNQSDDQSQYTYNGDSQAPSDLGSQSQNVNDQSAQSIPESQELATKAPFGLRPCCQGSKKNQKPRPQRPIGFNINSGFNADQNQNTETRPTSSFTGQKEVFSGSRKPPSFDENGYHY